MVPDTASRQSMSAAVETVSPEGDASAERWRQWQVRNAVVSRRDAKRARIAFTVCMQSSLGRNPRSVHTPLERAATITARCEMLLSPGTLISRSIRGARFIRNSIESI